MASVDLMQNLRAAAFTALTKVMSDKSVEPELRVQAAIAVLTFGAREAEDAWVYAQENAMPDGVPPLVPVPDEDSEDGA